MKKTSRGFSIYGEYKDSRGNTLRVQKSSSAMEDAVWIFVKDKDGQEAYEHLGEIHAVSPHLTKAQARRVAAALMKFANEP